MGQLYENTWNFCANYPDIKKFKAINNHQLSTMCKFYAKYIGATTINKIKALVNFTH